METLIDKIASNNEAININIHLCNKNGINYTLELIKSINISPKDSFTLVKFKKSLCYTLLDAIAKCTDIKNHRERFKMIVRYSCWEYTDIISIPYSYNYILQKRERGISKKLHGELEKIETCLSSMLLNKERNIQIDKLQTKELFKLFPKQTAVFKSYADVLYDDRNNLIHEFANSGSIPTIEEDKFDYFTVCNKSDTYDELNVPPSELYRIIENVINKIPSTYVS